MGWGGSNGRNYSVEMLAGLHQLKFCCYSIKYGAGTRLLRFIETSLIVIECHREFTGI